MSVRFGTGGWRGILGDDFTLPRVSLVATALARLAAWMHPGAPILLGHDTRALGEPLCARAAAAIAAEGVRVLQARGPVPTPVVAVAVPRRRAAAGLVFTASHNPPAYHGLKLLTAEGAPAPPALTRRIEALADAGCAPPRAGPAVRGRRARADLVSDYLAQLGARLDRARIKRARISVVYDALHGAGAGVADRALREAGLAVATLHARPDPGFGGGAPDPVPERLGALRAAVGAGGGLRFGVATDGDADRFATVDETGRVLSEAQALAVLIDHLGRTGRLRGAVALSEATGALVARVAAAHGAEVLRRPIGFKHLALDLVEGRAAAAGEVSGGFAWSRLGCHKDGILAACLLAEAVALDGLPLSRQVARLERAHGRSCCGRIARAGSRSALERLERLRADPPTRAAGTPVRAADTRHGLRLSLDDGFLMLRASGTEPLVRIYAEAPDRRGLAARLRAGVSLLGPAG